MNAPLAFQDFQYAFARHIRAPRQAPRPAGVPARRMRVYNELLYNNLRGFVDACFPVARGVLGERRWSRLTRTFFADWRSRTPYFREIPREFLRWLMEGEMPLALPPWLAELAHYEWAELAVDVMDVTPAAGIDGAGDLLLGRPVVNPALMNLAYHWPVHRIGPDHRPRKAVATSLLVYRRLDDEVAFFEITPVTARLITLLQAGRQSGRGALLAVAAELSHPEPEVVVANGAAQLQALREAEVLLGVLP